MKRLAMATVLAAWMAVPCFGAVTITNGDFELPGINGDDWYYHGIPEWGETSDDVDWQEFLLLPPAGSFNGGQTAGVASWGVAGYTIRKSARATTCPCWPSPA